MGIQTYLLFIALSCTHVSSALGLKTCSSNGNLMKSIQYQLKLVEDNDGNCNCGHQSTLEQKIGFFARNSNALQNRAPGSTVIYDDVVTNLGSGYNLSTGIFTAPSDGLYNFAWTTLSKKEFGTLLYLNKKHIAGNYANSSGSSNPSSGSQSVILNLKKGDEVAIKVWAGGQFMWNDKWSSFSGFKI